MRVLHSAFCLALAALVVAGGCAPALAPAVPDRTAGVPASGALATDDARATAAGLDALRDGGNAVDAAVAAALVLAVVFPEAGNLGGGGFAVVSVNGEVAALDFREVAPAAARRDLYLDAHGEPIPDASKIGPLAAGVPGSPAGLHALHRRFGRLPWSRVVAPARRFATDGFAVDAHLLSKLSDPKTRSALARFPETAAFWLPGGSPPPVGTVIRQPALASTLAAYAERGPAGVTEGPAAVAIEAAARAHGGILTAADLAAYRPVWREPLRFEAFGWQLATMPLPSAGGVLLGESFGILERLGWQKLPRPGSDRADRAHLLAETFRAVYADRTLLADPATARAGPAQLWRPAWLDRRAALVDRARATPSAAVRPWPGTGEPVAKTTGLDTTHLSVIDGAGNLVALTTTLNDLFGCSFYVPDAGFFLNNEMDDFTTAPGRPNLFGLIQGEANAVAPGRRMLSSMTPTLAWRGTGAGREAVVVGGRGGSRITTGAIQVLLALLVDGAALQEAVDRPRLHHQWLPDRLEVEDGALSVEAARRLERRGQTLLRDPTDNTKIHAARRRADGCLEAAADRRGPGQGASLDPVCPVAPLSGH